jgi:DinB family protein
VTTYGARVWGDPCPGCGYSWATTYEEALELIAGAASRYRQLIRGREEAAMVKPAPDTWSPSGYVWHLSDWFRIQGQRIYTIAKDPLYRWVHLRIDPAELGEIFKYDEQTPTGGLWALQKAADMFVEAATDADRSLVFDTGEADSWTVGELVVWVAHEVIHHDKDIRSGLGAARRTTR